MHKTFHSLLQTFSSTNHGHVSQITNYKKFEAPNAEDTQYTNCKIVKLFSSKNWFLASERLYYLIISYDCR